MTDPGMQTEGDEPVADEKSIGPYRIIGRLGRGGMAEVLLTLQEQPLAGIKRLVVVKRVLPELLEEDPRAIQVFLDEARLAARLTHPNVVQTFEVGQAEGLPYIAMEFLDGQTVDMLQRRAYAQGRRVSVDIALRVFCDALEGLHYAHELKDFDGNPLDVIHRDVTPSNLFVTYDGSTKLVDFGIAKSATQREKTRAGTLKGKMPYMAPEQFRSTAITRGVDLWAIAVVLWETLAGERLFRSKNSFETMQAVAKRPVPRLSERRDDVPTALDDVLARAFERDPARRIQTADEMRAALEEVGAKLEKTPRRADVAKVMQDLFDKSMKQNRALIKDFLGRSANIDTQNEYVRLKATSGALELEVGTRAAADEAIDAAQDGSNPDDPRTAGNESSGSFATGRTSSTAAPVAPVATAPSVSQRLPAANVPPTVPTRVPVPGRPLWHWAVMAVAIALLIGTIAAVLRH